MKNSISIKHLLEYAPSSISEREFAKWEKDDDAWVRVMQLDSLYLSKIYLDRYPNGSHEAHARQIILDDDYDADYDRYKISSNYCGNTTIEVINRSSYETQLHYDGTFANGEIKVSGNSRRSVSVPNGYYRISIYSQKLHTKGIHERIVCDGGYIPYDLELKQDFSRH